MPHNNINMFCTLMEMILYTPLNPYFTENTGPIFNTFNIMWNFWRQNTLPNKVMCKSHRGRWENMIHTNRTNQLFYANALFHFSSSSHTASSPHHLPKTPSSDLPSAAVGGLLRVSLCCLFTSLAKCGLWVRPGITVCSQLGRGKLRCCDVFISQNS